MKRKRNVFSRVQSPDSRVSIVHMCERVKFFFLFYNLTEFSWMLDFTLLSVCLSVMEKLWERKSSTSICIISTSVHHFPFPLAFLSFLRLPHSTSSNQQPPIQSQPNQTQRERKEMERHVMTFASALELTLTTKWNLQLTKVDKAISINNHSALSHYQISALKHLNYYFSTCSIRNTQFLCASNFNKTGRKDVQKRLKELNCEWWIVNRKASEVRIKMNGKNMVFLYTALSPLFLVDILFIFIFISSFPCHCLTTIKQTNVLVPCFLFTMGWIFQRETLQMKWSFLPPSFFLFILNKK